MHAHKLGRHIETPGMVKKWPSWPRRVGHVCPSCKSRTLKARMWTLVLGQDPTTRGTEWPRLQRSSLLIAYELACLVTARCAAIGTPHISAGRFFRENLDQRHKVLLRVKFFRVKRAVSSAIFESGHRSLLAKSKNGKFRGRKFSKSPSSAKVILHFAQDSFRLVLMGLSFTLYPGAGVSKISKIFVPHI